MYETEELWRAKRKAPSGPGVGSLVSWLLRIGLIGGLGIAGLAVFLNLQDGLGPARASRTQDDAELRSEESAGDDLAGFDRELILRRAANGHFQVTANVQGVPVHFLVDTGASDVAISADVARQIGINLHSLDYNRRYQTANGEILAAPVTLRDVRIGDLRVYDVEASVTQADMGISLLGMSFLNKLSSFEVNGTELVLRW